MAGIKTSISLRDDVSPALRKMVSALENLENVLSSVDSRFRNAFDTQSIKAVENEIAKSVQLTKLQASEIEKLKHQITASERARIKLEEESAALGNVMIQKSVALADLKSKLNLATKRQAESEAVIAERLHQINELEKTIAAAKNDEEVSASQIEAMELRRNRWVAQVERLEARVVSYKREIKSLGWDIQTADLMDVQAKERKAEISEKINKHLADEAHLGNRISAIYDKAAKNQANLAAQQAKRVQQALNGIWKEEAAMQRKVAAMNREDAAKLAAWDKQQAQMGKMIVKAEQLERKKRQIKPAIDDNTRSQEKFNASLRKGNSTVDTLSSKIKSMVGAYVGVRTAGSIINTADSLAANDARLNLMVKEGESVKELNDQIYAAAMRSRSGYLQMADSVSKVGIQAGNLFNNSGDMVRFMETFNKMGVISKATTQQTNAAMTQLIQALSFGQLRGDELKSILENMPMVAHALADELTRTGVAAGDLPEKLRNIAADGKVTADEIRALGYEGQISAETVVNAMLNGSKKIDEMAANMTWTWAQVWEVFKNSAMKAFTPVLNGISAIIQTERFKRFATWIDHAMTRVSEACNSLWTAAGPVFADIFDWVAKIGGYIHENWTFIAPIILGIVAALTFLKIASMVSAIWTAALTGAKILLTFFTWACSSATLAQAGAQWGLNSAMLACPITWIIVAIAAIIAVIYLAVAAINHFAGTSISGTGIVFGAFAWLFGTIWNIIVGLWNGLLAAADGVFDIVLGVVEWFLNVMNGGFNSFAGACANLIGQIIGWFLSLGKVVTTIIDAIFGTNWTAGLESLKSKVTSWGKNENAITITRDWSSSKLSLGRVDAEGWAKNAYGFGEGIDNKVTGFFEKDKLKKITDSLTDPSSSGAVGDFSKALENGFKNPDSNPAGKDYAKDIAGDTADIAKNTGETAKNTEMSDDDFKYLHEAVRRDSMNRSQLMNFKIDMSNVNHIKSGLDVDEVMRRLAKELYNEVVSKMEGVY